MSRIRQGGGFGIVVLLVVLAVILLLASRAWKSVLPTALDVAGSTKSGEIGKTSPPDAVNSGAGQAPINSRLKDAKQKTDVHSAQVEKALGE